jgi:hypothetical protein
LLVVLRCLPCEECVKLDDDLIDKDLRVRLLLDKFVCVRIVSTNGLDLRTFQFDTDQSFAVFMMNADGTIYGRFGTRSHRTAWEDDVSVDGLAAALLGALDLHAEYPRNKAALAAKIGPVPQFASPELFPLLKDRYTSKVDYAGDVVKSCIHCHMIGEAQRQTYRDRRETTPESELFPYPHPKAVGLILDPKKRATVLRVEPDTPAERSGFKSGDVIEKLAGQPLLSIADVQWVLNRETDDRAAIRAAVRRGQRDLALTLDLPKGWRQRDDISWRSSTWGYRRMVAGGMLLGPTSAAERKDLGLADSDMALTVNHVGASGPHGAAKKAGVQKGDVLMSFDGKTNLRRETDLIAYALTHLKVDS